MPYRIVKDEDVIDSADVVKVEESGILYTYEDRTVGVIENHKLIGVYAWGQWDVVYWEDPE